MPPRASCDIQVFLAAPAQQDTRDLDRAWAMLDADEKQRAERLLRDDDRRAYLVAHALLRGMICRTAGLDAGDAAGLRFTRTAHGRPELAGGAGAGARRISFNLSHTRDLVGCALLLDPAGDVGFDLEAARKPAPLEVASRFFSARELAALRALPPARQWQRFYTLWTLKEAYLKARGSGLALPLDSFTVELQPRGRAQLLVDHPDRPGSPADAANWTLRWWRAGLHLAAIAVDAPSPATRVRVRTGLRIVELATRASPQES